MTTITLPVKIVGGHPTIPVKVTNPKTNKSITIPMTLDTGWDVDRIDLKYGNTLGFNPRDSINASTSSPNRQYDTYFGRMTIGTLKPIETLVQISTANVDYNVFGALPMRQFDKFIITRNSAIISDSTTGGGSITGLAAVMKDFGKYVFTGGVPVLAPAQKQAAYVSAYNALPSWKKRI